MPTSDSSTSPPEALIVPDLVRLDVPVGPDKKDVIEYLADVVASAGRADTPEGLAADALAREATAPTGIPGGIAIPHCRSPHVLAPSLGFARLTGGVDFGAADGESANLVFMIAAPAGADDFHLKLLAKLARGLMKPEFTGALRSAATPQDVARIITEQVQPELLEEGAAQADGADGAAERAAGAGSPPRRSRSGPRSLDSKSSNPLIPGTRISGTDWGNWPRMCARWLPMVPCCPPRSSRSRLTAGSTCTSPCCPGGVGRPRCSGP